jgi:RNA polymerase sigma factor for flagellar operon FliA
MSVEIGGVETIGELWAEYKTAPGRATRDRLILHYSPIVKYVAGRVLSRLPDSVDGGDLVSYGILGLIDAIEKFEPTRGVKFETYSVPRIRGAILDELRSIDWVPRSVRAKARAADKAYNKLEHNLKRSPTDAELAAELGITSAELDSLNRQTTLGGVLQLDEVLFSGQQGAGTLGDTIADPREGPGAVVEREETRKLLARAIVGLADRERTVLTLYYYEGLKLSEIGDVLGVTESRACQIHTKAVSQLRYRLRDQVA